MLVEAEKERQNDSSACQEHTRCKVGKCIGRLGGYEYTDIDNGFTVSVEEYRRRYLRFIYRKKPQHLVPPGIFENENDIGVSISRNIYMNYLVHVATY